MPLLQLLARARRPARKKTFLLCSSCIISEMLFRAVVTGTAAAAGAGAPAGAPEDAGAKPLWLSEAEFSAKALVLSWEGIGSTVATWHPRWLYVWRGRLYVTRERDDSDYVTKLAYWRGFKVGACTPHKYVVGDGDSSVCPWQ